MLIIVEGNDCSGKTTLVKHFKEATVIHFGAPVDKNAAFSYWRVYAKAIESVPEDRLTIFDRCWLSDCVYGPVLRDEEEMSIEMANMLNAAAAAKGGIMIYCKASLKVINKRFKQRGDDLIKDTNTLAALQKAYEENVQLMRNIPVLTYVTG